MASLLFTAAIRAVCLSSVSWWINMLMVDDDDCNHDDCNHDDCNDDDCNDDDVIQVVATSFGSGL